MPKTEVSNLLHRFKNNLEQKMAVDKRTGLSKSYNSPGPVDNIVYSITKDGKGAISVQDLGGDVNVKDIMDLDYFNNKKLAALKIPKQFLNFDSPEGIGGNGTSLTKISSRYAHTIKRIQNAYIQGITNLINYFFMDKNLDYVNKFTIKMVSPSTVEDAERAETLANNISQVRDLMDLVSELPEDDQMQILAQLFSEKLNLTDISDIIQEYADKLEAENSDEDTDEFGDNDDFNDDFDNDFNHSGGGHRLGGSDSIGSEFNDFEEPNFEMETETNLEMPTPPPQPEITPEE